MIGLHQMSYSPAAAAAAATAPTASEPTRHKSSKSRAHRQVATEEDQFSERGHKQEMRRQAQYHQFDSTLDYNRRTRNSGGQTNIIRVPARTAHPIVVDSVPECVGRKARGSSRRQADSMLEPHRQRQPQVHYGTQELGVGALQERSHEMRHFLLQQALEQSSRDEQQVLLIMADNSSKTGGIPVLGRRLPSKSFAPPAGCKPLLVQELPPVVTEAILQHQQQQLQQQQAPVIGRRSHRMLEQHQQHQQLESVDQSQKALKCASLSILNSLESQVESRQRESMRQRARGASSKKLASKRKSGAQFERRASNSCSSLCSQAPAPVCLESCCQPAPVELLRCHTSCAESQPLSVATSSLLPVCLLPCCYAAPSERAARRSAQVRSSSQSASRRSYHSELGAHRLHQPSQRNGGQPHKSSRASRQRHSHQGPPVPSKPALAPYQRAETPDESEHVTQMYESLAAELKAKLGNSDRAPILLPPKDYDTLSRQQGKLNGIELRRSTNPQLVGPAVASSAASGSLSKTSLPNHCQQSLAASTSAGSPTSLSPLHSGHCASTVGELSSSRSSGRGSETNGLSDSRVDSIHRSRSNSSSGLGSISLGARSPSSACSAESPTSKASSSEHIDQQLFHGASQSGTQSSAESAKRQVEQDETDVRRGKGIENHNPSKVSGGILWNGRVEIPLKVNSERRNGNTYLATKQIIY